MLAREHAVQVTLWIDALHPLARMAPAVDAACDAQHVDGVQIRRWCEPWIGSDVPDVVVEAFGCGLPEGYVLALAARDVRPPWIVLEYLSAETWVDGLHGRPSPHPRHGIPRRYCFPGFTASTGGLLRERGLLRARDAFQRDGASRERWWDGLGIPVPVDGELRVSLFCYAGAPVRALVDGFARGSRRVTLLVPEGIVDLPSPAALPPHVRAYGVPFLPQDGYDRLLWACDLNLVRGEDSFVRAQWAARPCIWQAYPQAGAAHQAKVSAFMARYGERLDADARSALATFTTAWNGSAPAGALATAWLQLDASMALLARHAEAWADALAQLPELSASLVRMAASGV